MEKLEDEIFCPECAKPIKKDFTICPYCRTEIIIQKDSSDNVAVDKIDNHSDYSIRCPICKNSLTSYKVSAIYSSGMSTSSYSGSAVSFITPLSSKGSSSIAYTPINLTGVNISELSNKLSRPIKPGSYSTGGCLMAFLIILPILSGLFFLVQTVFLLMFVNITTINVIRIILPIVFIIVEVIIILAIRRGIRGIGKQAKLNKNNYENSLKRWQEECVQWGNLYYCFKHDIVFDPSSGEYTSAENLDKIYERPSYKSNNNSDKKLTSISDAEKWYNDSIAQLDRDYNELWNDACKDLGLQPDSKLPEDIGKLLNKDFDKKYKSLSEELQSQIDDTNKLYE